jgi:hypothetical protein
MSFIFKTSVRCVPLAGAALLLAPLAHADWTGKGEAGLLISRGNADSTSGQGKRRLEKCRVFGLFVW